MARSSLYIRAGKCLPVTCTELLIRLRRPPRLFSADALMPNHFRFRISPDVTIALGMMVKSPDDEMFGEPIEMVATGRSGSRTRWMLMSGCCTTPWLGDATLFAREDYVEEAWRIVDPVLKANTPVYEYEPGTWGPAEVERKNCARGRLAQSRGSARRQRGAHAA